MKKFISLLLLPLLFTGCSWLEDDKEETPIEVRTYPVVETDFESVYALMETALKDQLLAMLSAQEMPEKMEVSTTLELSVDYADEYQGIKANLNLENEEKADVSDVENPLVEGYLALSGNMEERSTFFEEEMVQDYSIDGELDYKVIGKEVFAYLRKLDLGSSDEMTNQMINDQLGVFLNPWMEKWLVLNIEEVLENNAELSDMVNLNVFMQAWSPDYVANQIEKFFGPDLLKAESNDVREEDGFLVYEVSLDTDGLADIIMILMEQSTISNPMMIEGMEEEMREDLSRIDIRGELRVLKEDAKQFTMDLDVREDDFAIGELKMEWLSDKKTLNLFTNANGNVDDSVYLEWLVTGEDEGTFFVGTMDRSIKAIEGSYDDDGFYFEISMEPDTEDSPKVVGDMEKDDGVYSGTIVLPEEEFNSEIVIEVEALELSNNSFRMIGSLMMDNNEIFSMSFESEQKEVDSVEVERPEEPESLTPMISNFLSAAMMGMNYQSNMMMDDAMMQELSEEDMQMLEEMLGSEFPDEASSSGGFFMEPDTETQLVE